MSLSFRVTGIFHRRPGQQGRNKTSGRYRAWVLFPAFLLSGESSLSLDTTVSSELWGLPLVEVAETSVMGHDVTSAVAGISDREREAVRCRWQADRVLLASLGQATSAIPLANPIDDCMPDTPVESVEKSAVNRAIQEKVIALTAEEYPLAAMAESIAVYDTTIAGLIVGIAKKESNWGKRTPKLHGEECFNYWGYRGRGNRGMTADGYGCFEDPSDAVEVIGNRLVELSHLRGTADPERMVVWKCGSSCATHSPESVRKWIDDVSIYYHKFVAQS